MSKCDSAGQHGDRMKVAVIYGVFLYFLCCLIQCDLLV